MALVGVGATSPLGARVTNPLDAPFSASLWAIETGQRSPTAAGGARPAGGRDGAGGCQQPRSGRSVRGRTPAGRRFAEVRHDDVRPCLLLLVLPVAVHPRFAVGFLDPFADRECNQGSKRQTPG